MLWRIHKTLIGNPSNIEKVNHYASSQGDTVQWVEGRATIYSNPLPAVQTSDILFCFTTIEDLKSIQIAKKQHPDKVPYKIISFCEFSKFNYDQWVSQVEVDVLNQDGIFLNKTMLKRHTAFFEGKKEIFIKSNSSQKLLTGFVLPLPDIGKGPAIFKHFQEYYPHIQKNDLIFLASTKQINSTEYRFWIRKGKIVASTMYSWHDDIEYDSIPSHIQEKAQQLANQYPEDIDVMLVADFVIDKKSNKPFLMEINSVSTSGWYQVEPLPILEEVKRLINEEIY